MLLAFATNEILAAAAVITAVAAVAAALVAIWNTRRSVEALDMPFVIAVPQRRGWWIGWETMADSSRLRARLLNVGRGPAIVGDMRLTVEGTEIIAPAGGEIPLSAGASQKHTVQLLEDKASEGPNRRGVLRIYYAHASGWTYMTTSEAIVTGDGLLCKDFRRSKSDRGDRPLTH